MSAHPISTILKPFDRMSIEELHRERAYWDKYIREAEDVSVALGVARDLVSTCDALIARHPDNPQRAAS